MSSKSAGLFLFRKQKDQLEVFLVHPGGPFWAKKDSGSWSIPKGEFDREDALTAARREFTEETGLPAPHGEYIPLTAIKQKGGKTIHAWAVEGEIDAEQIRSNHFEAEWPPQSGTKQSFPEIDRGAWFSVEEALEKINQRQADLIYQLMEKVAG